MLCGFMQKRMDKSSKLCPKVWRIREELSDAKEKWFPSEDLLQHFDLQDGSHLLA